MAKKHPFPADLPPADPTLKAGLYDALAPRLATLSQDVALAHARSVVPSLCHMAGVRRVRAVVAAADAEGLVDLGARTLSALNPSAVSLASSAFPGTPHAAITLLDCVLRAWKTAEERLFSFPNSPAPTPSPEPVPPTGPAHHPSAAAAEDVSPLRSSLGRTPMAPSGPDEVDRRSHFSSARAANFERLSPGFASGRCPYNIGTTRTRC